MASISSTTASSRFHPGGEQFGQQLDIAILNMPTVFAQMNGDSVGTGLLGNGGGLDH